jgi:hypothetical protein
MNVYNQQGILPATTTAANAANQANLTQYQNALNQLAGGYNSAEGSINNALATSGQYGQYQMGQLGLQLQQNLGQQQQSAVSRGLGNTTIANTMQALPQMQYNQAATDVMNQAANRASGLQLDLSQLQTGGANQIANLMGQLQQQQPNVMAAYQLQQQQAAAQAQQKAQAAGIQQANGMQNQATIQNALNASTPSFLTNQGSGGVPNFGQPTSPQQNSQLQAMIMSAIQQAMGGQNKMSPAGPAAPAAQASPALPPGGYTYDASGNLVPINSQPDYSNMSIEQLMNQPVTQ